MWIMLKYDTETQQHIRRIETRLRKEYTSLIVEGITVSGKRIQMASQLFYLQMLEQNLTTATIHKSKTKQDLPMN